MKKLLIVSVAAMALLVACQDKKPAQDSSTKHEEVRTENPVKEQAEKQVTKGQEMIDILGSTNWQATKAYDKDHNDVTAENANFIGLAKYNADAGHYELFDVTTGESRGDQGTFFITNDGKHRVFISESKDAQTIVDIIELNDNIFTYKRMGKDAAGNDVEVFVEHIPYKEKELTFTDQDKTLDSTTGDIVTDVDGDVILAKTLWQGSAVLDEAGNDVTQLNTNFISIAKYDANTNQYEFFNPETGKSRGDYGYFNVIHNNKIRAHMSVSEKKYGIALEITELNDKKFTYKRTGKDKDGNDITVFVEHTPYKGEFKPEFTLQ
ncbi:DUF4822 domain-containing protein [Lysinibacillus sp. FSL K6-0232]|uniref:DUF4822 domain-containing protein n=1 Tax=unclassified Lysinibacillus TaxID=2636778 RepID=UPI0030FA0CF4